MRTKIVFTIASWRWTRMFSLVVKTAESPTRELALAKAVERAQKLVAAKKVADGDARMAVAVVEIGGEKQLSPPSTFIVAAAKISKTTATEKRTFH
jgi:hypothetical protein